MDQTSEPACSTHERPATTGKDPLTCRSRRPDGAAATQH